MPILLDMIEAIRGNPNLAKDIGLDMNDARQKFNFCQALRQIEAHANGAREKPLGEMREMGFDMNRDLPRLGIENLKHVLNSGDVDAALKSFGMDSTALYGATELTYFDPRFWEQEHAILVWRDLFPISHNGDPADEQYNYKLEILEGRSQFTNAQGNTRFKVDIIEEDTFEKYHEIDIEFEVTLKDMRAAIKTGRPIEVRKMKAAARSSEEQMNETIILGSDELSLKGIANRTDIPEDVVADGAGGGDPKLWVNKTPNEILVGDIGYQASQMKQTTFNRHAATHLGLSIDRYEFLSQTWISELIAMSLLEWLQTKLKAYGIQEIVSMPELDGAGPGGAEVGILWEKTENAMQIDISQELIFQTPQWQGKKMIFIGTARISELMLRRLKAQRRFTSF